MYGSLENFPLRQINFVKTRTTVLKAVIHLLKEKRFEEITVDEICQTTQISRGTFFNYFPSKEYIFYYYLRIFTIKITQRIKHWDEEISFRKQLEQLYIWFDEESQYPEFTSAYIKYLLDDGPMKDDVKLTAAEFVYFFTDINDEKAYAYYNNLTILDIIKDLIDNANEKEKFPQKLDPTIAPYILLSMLLSPFIIYKMSNNQLSALEVFNIILDDTLES